MIEGVESGYDIVFCGQLLDASCFRLSLKSILSSLTGD